MPNEYSNFTNADTGSSSQGQQAHPPGTHWDPGVWNPQTQQMGSYVQDNGQTAGNAAPPVKVQNNVQGAWGHQGDTLDANGAPIAGTNGMAQDRDRYRTMGQAPTDATGPQIDRTASNQTRDMSMGSLDLLGQTAAGTSPSAAEQLGSAQTRDAQNAQYSMGASVRGGAMARAAAARSATMGAARVGAIGGLQNAATRAGEMANARTAYNTAATGQRGEDLGLASSQATLNAGQNALNDNREGFYEGLAQDTQQANLNHQLGRSEADAAAAQGSYNNSVARDEASRAATMRYVDQGLGGATGLMSGAQYAAKGNPSSPTPAPTSSDPWDPSNYSGSDARMKRDIHPISDKEAKRLSDQAGRILPGYRAMLPESKAKAAEPAPAYDGKYLSGLAYRQEPDVISGPTGAPKPMDTAGLHSAIEQQIADDNKNPPTYGYFDEADGNTAPLRLSAAPKGYAAERAGQPGGMFGAQQAPQSGPMTQNQREVMMSDDHAKVAAAEAQAYALGRAHQSTSSKAHPVEWAYPAPDDIVEPTVMTGPRGHAAVETHKAASTTAARAQRPRQELERTPIEKGVAAIYQSDSLPLPQVGITPMTGFQTAQGITQGVTSAQQGYQAALESPPVPPQAARAQTVSDSDAKYGTHDVGAMAEANLSMKPRAYKYKPGFAEREGQTASEENVGPIAQDMAANPIAKTVIVKDPNTGLLGIDKDKGLKLVMGGLADLQAQVDSIQKKKATR